jgi:hypothetical protein
MEILLERQRRSVIHRKVHLLHTLKPKLEALLILLCVVAIIVGACIWFFRFNSPAVVEPKKDLPPFEPAKPASPETFKP